MNSGGTPTPAPRSRSACRSPDSRRPASTLWLPLSLSEQAPALALGSLLSWTSCDSAAFARASTTALAGKGRAAAIACASVVGVELHMHPDVGVCSIGYDELIAVLLLREQRGYAAQRAPGLWNGRAGELDRAVGRLLLVTLAEVWLEDAALRRHRLREVCDSYMRMPSETTASVSSPTDDR